MKLKVFMTVSVRTNKFDLVIINFSNYSANSKYYDYLNALFVGKMKDEMGGVAIKVFVELHSKMYSNLVNNYGEL